MWYSIIATPIKDEEALKYYFKHPPENLHRIYDGPESALSLHFGPGMMHTRKFHNPEKPWLILGFFEEDENSEKEPKKVEGLTKDLHNWLRGKRAKRIIYRHFLEYFKDETDSKARAQKEMEVLRGCLSVTQTTNNRIKNLFVPDSFEWDFIGMGWATKNLYNKNAKEGGSVEEYESNINKTFFDPLHNAILMRATSMPFRNLLLTKLGIDGQKETFLEQISEKLFQHYIVDNKGKLFTSINLSHKDIKKLRISSADIRPLMHDLSKLISEVVVIKDMTDDINLNPHKFPWTAKMFFPEAEDFG